MLELLKLVFNIIWKEIIGIVYSIVTIMNTHGWQKWHFSVLKFSSIYS